MSVISCATPNSSGNCDKKVSVPKKSACESAWYHAFISAQDDAPKVANAVNEKVQNSVWIPHDIANSPKSEFAYVAPPIAVALFRGQWGWGICRSKPFSLIPTILARCVYYTSANNYCRRAEDQWFCTNAMTKGLAPLDL